MCSWKRDCRTPNIFKLFNWIEFFLTRLSFIGQHFLAVLEFLERPSEVQPKDPSSLLTLPTLGFKSNSFLVSASQRLSISFFFFTARPAAIKFVLALFDGCLSSPLTCLLCVSIMHSAWCLAASETLAMGSAVG